MFFQLHLRDRSDMLLADVRNPRWEETLGVFLIISYEEDSGGISSIKTCSIQPVFHGLFVGE